MSDKDPSDNRPQTRRSTHPRRKHDPEHTRRLVLAAAAEEFARHGYDGARVGRIAEAAGVGRQLITYHFGGKSGLYDALTERWLDRNSDLLSGPEPFVQLVREQVSWVHEDEGWARTLVREAIDESVPISDERVVRLAGLVEKLRLRQKRGEISDEFDVGALSLAFLAACTAPAIMPALARTLVGLDPSSTAFPDLYAEELARIASALSGLEPDSGPEPAQPRRGGSSPPR
jgi:TetR/AcrR family transcriptional regulator